MRILIVDPFRGAYTVKTPTTSPLGGTQSAVCYYAIQLSQLGHEIILVNNTERHVNENDIQHYSFDWYFSQKNFECDIIIMCSGIISSYINAMENNFKYKLSIFWNQHYGFEPAIKDAANFLYHFDLFVFVSDYQRNDFCKRFGLPIDKSFLMLNGIAPDFHTVKITNKTNRCIYASNPQRGLTTLANIWPTVLAVHPTVKLDVYSSMKTYGGNDSEETVNDFKRLRAIPNVTVHESTSVRELAKASSQCAFLIYPTHFVETSCIVALQSGAAGVLPLYTDMGVFNSYDSNTIHYGYDFENEFAQKTIEALHKFQRNRKDFNKHSKDLSDRIREEHDYKTLAKTFIQNCKTFIEKKNFAILRNSEIITMTHPILKVYLSESMPLLFQSSTDAAIYFLKLGNYYFNSGYSHNSEFCYLQSWKIQQSSGSCSNLIEYYNMTENIVQLVHWIKVYLSKYTLEIKYLKLILNYYDELDLFSQFSLIQFTWEILYNSPATWITTESIYFASAICLKLHFLYSEIGNNEAAIQILRQLVSLIQTKAINVEENKTSISTVLSNLIFRSNYGYKDAHYMTDCLSYEKIIPMVNYKVEPFSKVYNKQLRIGFLSSDFKNHPVTEVLNGFVSELCTYPIEIYLINNTNEKNSDDMAITYTKQFITSNVIINNVDSIESIKIIETLNLDILIDMWGFTSSSPSKGIDIIRSKPARVVCSYFACPGTTGLQSVDFKLGDSICLNESSKNLFTEEFQTIEGGMHCFKPLQDIAFEKVKSKSGIRFCITNNSFKLSASFKSTVVRILLALPTSTLILSYMNYKKTSSQEYFYSWFERNGIDRSRISFFSSNIYKEYINVYNHSDISLDTFPYNGGTISIESLYYATPYVTLLGDDYVARIGASILTQIGHPELIATSEDDYVQKVVDLANDPCRLELYHNILHEDCIKSTLCNGKMFAKNFMAAMENMLDRKGFVRNKD